MGTLEIIIVIFSISVANTFLFLFVKKILTKKEKDERTNEQKLLQLVKNNNASFRMHLNSIREDEEDERTYLSEEMRTRRDEKQLEDSLFKKTIFHGQCLSCVTPNKLGSTICLGCEILDRKLGKDLYQKS